MPIGLAGVLGAVMLAVLKGTPQNLSSFTDHGIAAPFSHSRGIVATSDGQGRNIVLVWLMDHRGTYALLLIDTETGKYEQFPTPFPVRSTMDSPFANLLSSRNRLYTLFANHFVEFDPTKRAFTFWGKTSGIAMGLTEDDSGVIWAATYPNCGLVAFNPTTRELKDFGIINQENWAQYPWCVAVDDVGWVYVGIGYTHSQIVAFNPQTGEAKPMLPESERRHGTACVYRAEDGKVYGQPVQGEKGNWYAFHAGNAHKLGATPAAKPIQRHQFRDWWGTMHRIFPDGKRIRTCDLLERILVVEDPTTGETKTVRFDYETEGAHIMSVIAAPDDTVCGGTAFPFFAFRYDPKTDKWERYPCHGQWNTVAKQDKKVFVGGYEEGFLLEWDVKGAWVPTEKGNPKSNPRFLTQCAPNPAINRPHDLLAHPDGRTLILAGTPAYGYTGGGLLFWDRTTETATILEHTQLIPHHATMSLVALPNGKVVGGTTTAPGTGGEQKAKEAHLYLLDVTTKRLEWHDAVLPGVQEYTDLCAVNGLVFGVADRRRFFVFDPVARKILHERDLAPEFGLTVWHQGPRVFVQSPKGDIFILFVNGIGRVDPKTFHITLLAKSPAPITAGGDFVNGRIFFASYSRLYSFAVPE